MNTQAPRSGRLSSSSLLSAADPDALFPAQTSVRFLQRAFALAILFALELGVLSVWLDDAALTGRGGLAGFVQNWGAWILRGIVGFAALFGTFAWLKNRAVLQKISRSLTDSPIGWAWLGAHAGAMLLFAGFSAWLYGSSHLAGAASNALVGFWFVTGAAAIVLAALAFVPARAWKQLAGGAGSLWVFALVAIVLACVAGNYSRALWQPASRLTFALAEGMLKPFVPVVLANPATSMLGTPRFQVEIAPECSGFEGVGLMIAFGVAWLLLFRKESRFPQALLLIPAGVVVIYLLNAARLAALILIGNAGAERIALGGFHSQAGWIAFNFVALGFSVAARRTSWFAADVPAPDHAHDSVQNPVASWLMPLVAILAAGMLAHALSGDFEWLYPLRFFAAVATLWVFRRKYATLEWRASWIAPAAGIFAFILWIAMDRTGNPANDAMPAALAAATPNARAAWIFFRVLAAAVTVPVAEELAFRGYLLRRLVAADFESVSFQHFTWIAILVSSAIFGLLHGDRWFAGAVAGCIYALVYMRRGRIVEAVIAHGVTNALIAIDVLKLHRWHLW